MTITISHTLIIIAITAIISFIGFSNRSLEAKLLFYPAAINKGQLYRFVSYGFVHADMGHLLFNMFTLYFFGNSIEGLYNPYLNGFGFVAFYLLALIASIFPSYLNNINNPSYGSLGASGAVSAVLFAYILIAPWSNLYLFAAIKIPAIVFAVGYILYSLYAQRRARDNINHGAHLWGAAFGIGATLFLYPHLASLFIERLLSPPFLG